MGRADRDPEGRGDLCQGLVLAQVSQTTGARWDGRRLQRRWSPLTGDDEHLLVADYATTGGSLAAGL